MGKTKIYSVLLLVPIFLLLVTSNLHSQSELANGSYQQSGEGAQSVIKHKVKSGDSLLSLAYVYRTSAEEIKKINNLNRNEIYLGETLKIPYNSQGLQGDNSYIRYKVYKGDTISELAVKYKTDIQSIRELNDLSSNQVNYGQRLEIPYGVKLDSREGAVSLASQDLEDTTENDNKIQQVSNDSPYGQNLVSKIDSKVTREKELNSGEVTSPGSAEYKNLENNLRKNLSDENYSGLTPANEGMSGNSIMEQTASVNSDSEPETALETSKVSEDRDSGEDPESGSNVYVVKRGDNLSLIAEKNDATTGELKELNGLESNTLKPGQKIIIPDYDFTRYRVREGDNLSTIAVQNNTTVKELKELNDLKSSNVYIGQRIKIPSLNEDSSANTAKPDMSAPAAENVTLVNSGNAKQTETENITASRVNDKTQEMVKDLVNENTQKDILQDKNSDKTGDKTKSELKAVNTKNLEDTLNLKATNNIEATKQENTSDSSNYVKKFNKSDELDKSEITKPALSRVAKVISVKNKANINLAENGTNRESIIQKDTEKSEDTESERVQDSKVIAEKVVEPENSKNMELTQLNTDIKSEKVESGNTNSEDDLTAKLHKVSSGDNLSSLAVDYNTTVKEIKRVNDLKDNQIKIGQELIIPVAPQETETVKSVEINQKKVANEIPDRSDSQIYVKEIVPTKKPAENIKSEKVIENQISDVVRKSEANTSSDKIKQDVKNIAGESEGFHPVNLVYATASAKNSPILSQNLNYNNPDNKESSQVELSKYVKNEKNNKNETGIETIDDNESTGIEESNAEQVDLESTSHDKIQKPEAKQQQVALKSDISSQSVSTNTRHPVEDNQEDTHAEVLNDSSGLSKNISSNNLEDSRKQSEPDLQYKNNENNEANNKVQLAQLLSLEENSVPSEEDRYHTLVEEQGLLAKNDGNDRYVQNKETTPAPVETNESGEEIVNFPGEIDLRDLVQTMSEITNESFIVDDKLQSKKVTIITPKGGFSKANAIRLFEAILDLNGFTVYRNGAINVVTEKRDIKSVPLPIQEGRSIGNLSERFVTQIVPLKNIKAQDVANSLKPLISREGDIVVYEPLNTLIIVETKTNINKILTILENIDKEKEIVFVKVYNSDAADIAAMLTEIFGGTSASPVAAADEGNAASRRRSVTRRATRSQAATSEGGQVDITGFKIITDERTNSLIVIAYPEDIPKIKAAIERLDVKVAEPEHGIYLIRLKNADAEQVVNVLNSLISGVPLATPSSPESISPYSTSRQNRISPTSIPGRTSQSSTASSGGTLSNFEIEDVRITADTSTNSVIIVGSRREYEAIKRVVDEIDIRRKQVYVEAAILEVSLDQLKSLGTNLSIGFTFNNDNLGFGGTNLPGIPSLLGAAADSENAVTAVGSLSGMFLGVIGDQVDVDGSGPIPPIPSFTALFQALTSVTDVNILSTPSIVTTDNEEAEIVVADVIPFPTGSTVGDSGVTVQTIDREPVGIRLAITPQIGDGDFMNLQLHTEVSSIKDAPQDLNTEEFGIATATRTATSSVVVKNGQTIVIGGLVQDRESTLENKVPALGNIPVLGNLFKFTSKSNSKINLMILLTPRIIDDEKDMRNILEDRQNRNMMLQQRNLDEEKLLLQ